LLLGHNEDWCLPMKLYVVRAKMGGEKPGFISVGYAGQIPGTWASLNEAGIAYSADSVDARIVDFTGIPKIYLLRSLLEARSISDFESRMQKGNRTIGNSCLIASVYDGEIANLEWSPNKYDIQRVKGNGFLAHTNHYVLPNMIGERKEERDVISENGLARAEELLRKPDNQSVESFKTILSNHQDSPNVICYHPEMGGTIASIIINLADNAFYVSDGNPCRNEYKKFNL